MPLAPARGSLRPRSAHSRRPWRLYPQTHSMLERPPSPLALMSPRPRIRWGGPRGSPSSSFDVTAPTSRAVVTESDSPCLPPRRPCTAPFRRGPRLQKNSHPEPHQERFPRERTGTSSHYRAHPHCWTPAALVGAPQRNPTTQPFLAGFEPQDSTGSRGSVEARRRKLRHGAKG